MKKTHFIGLCGAGMSAVATLLKEQGHIVTGSDKGCHPPISDYLEAQNISCATGYSKNNIPEQVDLVVAGGSAKLNPEDNEEVAAAHKRGVSVTTFPQVLGEITKDRHTITVAGSYGKSTCTSLLAWCMTDAGKDSGYFIGALPLGMDTSAHVGTHDVFVLEGDEYLTSGLDPTSKFLYYPTHTILLTSGEHDHVNIFKTVEDYLTPFKDLLSRVPEDDHIFACTDNSNVAELVAPHTDKTITYGLNSEHNPQWTAQNIIRSEETTFDLVQNGSVVVSLTTTLLGDHNIQNIVGISAVLLEKDLLTTEELASAVRAFKGITRRLDKKTEHSSVLVYEGFGSSYEKARAAIAAMRTHFPDRPLVIVFEPHTFSWRNKDKLHWYDDIFSPADHTLVYKPAEIGVTRHDQVTHQEIMDRVIQGGAHATAITSEQEGLAILKERLTGDEVVLMLTSGNLGGLVASIPQLVEAEFPHVPHQV